AHMKIRKPVKTDTERPNFARTLPDWAAAVSGVSRKNIVRPPIRSWGAFRFPGCNGHATHSKPSVHNTCNPRSRIMSRLYPMTAAVLVTLAGLAVAQPRARPAGPAANANAVLTDESLGKMLDNMGLSPEKAQFTSGGTYYKVKLTQGKFTYVVEVSLSPSKQRVWFITTLRSGIDG